MTEKLCVRGGEYCMNIHREREIDTEREREREIQREIYIYIRTHTCLKSSFFVASFDKSSLTSLLSGSFSFSAVAVLLREMRFARYEYSA